MTESSMFKVFIENVMAEKDFLSSGVFNTPVGATEPGGAGPGNMYRFSFDAGPGTKLSFATMYVTSNDLFYAPSGEGIELFSGSVALTGDITSQVMLYDAGTEVNEEPGTGPNQPLNSGGGVGTAEGGTVQDISMVSDGVHLPLRLRRCKNHDYTHVIDHILNDTNKVRSPGAAPFLLRILQIICYSLLIFRIFN